MAIWLYVFEIGQNCLLCNLFISKFPPASSIWLFRWIKVDKYQYFHFRPHEMEIILFIHFYPPKKPLGQSQTHFMNKDHYGLFLNTLNEVIWPKKIKFHVWVKKYNYDNFTRNWPIGWMAYPVRAALHF